jgi:protein involved in polysaccharide export with SLBB domain
MAGGFTPLADRNRIELIRDERAHVAMDEELSASGGPPLRPGDRVMVGRVGWFRENLGVVIGAVGSLTVAVVTGLIVR